MMLIIILLFVSVGAGMVLIFISVIKYDERKLNIGILESSGMERIEHFDLYKSNSLLY